MKDKIAAGVAALFIYLTLIVLLLYYFGYHHTSRPTHFVTKNEQGIAVSLAGPPSAQSAPKPKPKATPKKRPSEPHKPVQRKKLAVTQKARKAPTAKKPDTRKLFSHVKRSPPRKPVQKRAAGAAGSKKTGERTLKKSQGSSGVENAYLAKVERLLKGWPAQANFAGEEIDIRLTIYPDGRFDYRILKLSANPDFNHELINYLKQLQGIGFGPHNRTKPYDIEVKFIAHD
jgi:outer membrane biosynthesis protein TonB